jgi:hypothetical protein
MSNVGQLFFLSISPYSSTPTSTASFSQMARMMDSLILDNLAPFAFTKITTTHRPLRSLKKATSTTNVPLTTANNNSNGVVHQNVGYTQGNGLGVPCMNSVNNMGGGGGMGYINGYSTMAASSASNNNATIRINLQNNKIPTQG